MPSQYCPRCERRRQHCLCSSLPQIQHQQRVSVLRHPSERYHGKATASLACASLQKAQMITGESTSDFVDLQQHVLPHAPRCAVIFPNAHSQPLETAPLAHINHWLFLDGTWRKAYKLWQVNPWLHNLASFHFISPPPSAYRIRKSPRNDGLSTLEAIAYTLKLSEGLNTDALLQVQQHLISRQMAHMSQEVKQRYD